MAHGDILGTADDLKGFFAVGDLGEGKAVRLGVLFNGKKLGNDDAW